MSYTVYDLIRGKYKLYDDAYVLDINGKTTFSSVHSYMLRKSKKLIIKDYNIGYISVNRNDRGYDSNINGYITAHLLVGENIFYKNIKDIMNINKNSGNIFWDIDDPQEINSLPKYYLKNFNNVDDSISLSSIGLKFVNFCNMSHSIMSIYEILSKNSKLQMFE